MRLTTIFCLLLLAVVPAFAQQASYEDPNGLYSVPIPTNWKVETFDGYALFSDPDGRIAVYALTVEDDGLSDAVAAAWKTVDPEFDLKITQTLDVPSAPGVDSTVVINYDTGSQTEIAQGYGQLVDGVAYILLFKGELNAFVQRNSQVQVIATGLTINALTKTDLTGVEPLAVDDAIIAELETYIEDTLKRLEVPGAAVAIVQNGEIVYAKGFGTRELGKDDPMTPDTLMMIGSTTKSMTTMMMATVVDDGLMQWDEPVVDILPTFAVKDPDLTQKLTVRNLVCACTGVPRRDFEIIFTLSTPQEIVESLATFEFFTDFGEAFQYSNQMVATGGYVAGLAAGGSYDNLYDDYVKAMQTRVFDPIGMPDTTFSFEEVEASGKAAAPHAATLLGDYMPAPISVEYFLSPLAPAGAVWSNVRDMARYIITELNKGVAPDGTRVVSAENLAETWQPQVAVSAETSYGLGWFVDEYKGLLMLHHGGNTIGYTSDLAFLPDANLGIVVLTNARASNLFNEAVRYRLLELVFEQEHEYEEQLAFVLSQADDATAKLEAKLGDKVDADAIAPYLGRYTNFALGDVTVAQEGSQYTFDAGEFKSELRPFTDDAGNVDYVVFAGPLTGVSVKFKEQEGKLVMVVGSSLTEYWFDKIE